MSLPEKFPEGIKVKRSDIIMGRVINLTQTNPLKRLQEFCNQGIYYYKFTWDGFGNGYMMTCEIYFNLGRKKVTVIRESQWIASIDIIEAKNIISAIVLHSIGLGIDDDEEENLSDDLVKIGMRAMTGVLNTIGQNISDEGMTWADCDKNDKDIH